MTNPSKDTIARFLSKVNKTSTCWQWNGATSLSYGMFRYEGRMQQAHRVAYQLFRGDIPEGLHLDHLCLNKGCVNPDHLEVVTNQQNLLRYHRSKTHCRKGHEYIESNIYWCNYKNHVSKSNPTGLTRMCKRCRQESSRKSSAAKRARKRVLV